VHGRLLALAGEEAAQALTALSESMLPGRRPEVPDHTRKQLAATQALAMDITDGQWTVKIRNAGPAEPPASERIAPDCGPASCRSGRSTGRRFPLRIWAPTSPIARSVRDRIDRSPH
jgi:hypothetical protein